MGEWSRQRSPRIILRVIGRAGLRLTHSSMCRDAGDLCREGRTRIRSVLVRPSANYFAGLMSGSDGTMFVAFSVTSVVSGLNAYPALTR